MLRISRARTLYGLARGVYHGRARPQYFALYGSHATSQCMHRCGVKYFSTDSDMNEEIYHNSVHSEYVVEDTLLNENVEKLEHVDCFDQSLKEITAMRMNSDRLVRVTQLIYNCTKQQDWLNLLKLGLYLISSPENYCYHSCLLIAVALSTSPHTKECLSYMHEMTVRNMEPHPSCLHKVLDSMIKKKDVVSLSDAIITFSRHNFMTSPHVLNYTLLLCLQKKELDLAEQLLEVAESFSGNVNRRRAFFHMYEFAPSLMVNRYQQASVLGLFVPEVIALEYLQQDKPYKAANILHEGMTFGSPIKPFSKIVKEVSVALLRLETPSGIGHGEENEFERFIRCIFRHVSSDGSSFKDVMRFWSSLGRSLGNNNSSKPVDILDSLRIACERRRLEVLYDMLESGVFPTRVNFKTALNVSTIIDDAQVIEDINQMNEQGKLKSLAGLWAAIMTLKGIYPLQTELISKLVSTNMESAIADTQSLLTRWGFRAFEKQSRKDESGVEKCRYTVESISEQKLQYVWTQLLSAVRNGSEMTDHYGASDYFDMDSEFLVLRNTVSKQLKTLKSEFPGASWTWFIRNRTLVIDNPLVKSWNLELVMRVYLKLQEYECFEVISDHVITHKLYNLNILSMIKNYCTKVNKMDRFYKIIVELAEGLCNIETNPYGADLLHTFKSQDSKVSFSGLHDHWSSEMFNRGQHAMLDAYLKETTSHLVEQLHAPKSRWKEKRHFIDDIAAITIAQTTCGLTVETKDMKRALIDMLVHPRITNMRSLEGYHEKVSKFGQLVQVVCPRDQAYNLWILLTHFSATNYATGVEELWEAKDWLPLVKVENFVQVLRVKFRRCRTDKNSREWLLNTFECALTSRGKEFGEDLLKDQEVLEMFLRTHFLVVNDKDSSPDDIAAALRRFERIISKMGDLQAICNYTTCTKILKRYEKDVALKTPKAQVWSILLYAERTIDNIALLPRQSVPIPALGPTPQIVNEILETFNDTIKASPTERQLRNLSVMTSVYPPRYLSGQEFNEICILLQDVLDNLAWVISPEDEDMFSRLSLCKKRLIKVSPTLGNA